MIFLTSDYYTGLLEFILSFMQVYSDVCCFYKTVYPVFVGL